MPPNPDDPSVDVTEEQRKIDEADALTEDDQAEKEALLTKVSQSQAGRQSSPVQTDPVLANPVQSVVSAVSTIVQVVVRQGSRGICHAGAGDTGIGGVQLSSEYHVFL